MQDIEPYFNWRHLYTAEEDRLSPFFGREYSEFEYTNTIYNYYIHPQWDYFGSPTMYMKVLYVDYDTGVAIFEFIGEWNDAINNDIMFLKRDIVDVFIANGISKYILIGENVLNYHASDDCYYQEWNDDIADNDGYIVGVNFRAHVTEELTKNGINYYLQLPPTLETVNWRLMKPTQLCTAIDMMIAGRRLE